MMAEKKQSKPRAIRKRPEGWSAEWLKDFIRNLPEGEIFAPSAFCKMNAGTSWQVMYREMMGWRKKDPELAGLIRARMRNTSQGRPAKGEDEENIEWRVNFIREYLNTGDKSIAAQVTPYTLRRINQFLSPENPDHDPRFYEMVREAEAKICSEMEGGMIQAFRDAEMPRDRAWIARSFLERRDPTRWGKQVELIHSGEIGHKHKHTHELKAREDILLELFEDQRRFLKREPLMLPDRSDVIEVSFEEVKERELA